MHIVVLRTLLCGYMTKSYIIHRIYMYLPIIFRVASLALEQSGVFNTLRPRQNGRHFADDIFKCIFLNENVWIPIKISMKFVPKGPINNIPALVQIRAWRCPGNKPLSEPMMVSLTTHICVTRPQWVNWFWIISLILCQFRFFRF